MRVKNCRSVIASIQKQFPQAVLGGSAALILQGVLPDRNIHDLDFVINSDDFDSDILELHESDNYGPDVRENFEPDYISYEVIVDGTLINFLVFDEEMEFDTATVEMKGLLFTKEITVEKPARIIAWKRKYNRPKDKIDLKEIDRIATKAVEEIFLDEKEESGVKCPDCGRRQIHMCQDANILTKIFNNGDIGKNKIEPLDFFQYYCSACDEEFEVGDIDFDK